MNSESEVNGAAAANNQLTELKKQNLVLLQKLATCHGELKKSLGREQVLLQELKRTENKFCDERKLHTAHVDLLMMAKKKMVSKLKKAEEGKMVLTQQKKEEILLEPEGDFEVNRVIQAYASGTEEQFHTLFNMVKDKNKQLEKMKQSMQKAESDLSEKLSQISTMVYSQADLEDQFVKLSFLAWSIIYKILMASLEEAEGGFVRKLVGMVFLRIPILSSEIEFLLPTNTEEIHTHFIRLLEAVRSKGREEVPRTELNELIDASMDGAALPPAFTYGRTEILAQLKQMGVKINFSQPENCGLLDGQSDRKSLVCKRTASGSAGHLSSGHSLSHKSHFGSSSKDINFFVNFSKNADLADDGEKFSGEAKEEEQKKKSGSRGNGNTKKDGKSNNGSPGGEDGEEGKSDIGIVC